jgi:hypothetical protein
VASLTSAAAAVDADAEAVVVTAGLIVGVTAGVVVGVVAGLVVAVGTTVAWGVVAEDFVESEDPHAARSTVVTPARLYLVMLFMGPPCSAAPQAGQMVEESMVGRVC